VGLGPASATYRSGVFLRKDEKEIGVVMQFSGKKTNARRHFAKAPATDSVR
jgi:hypothetical protein